LRAISIALIIEARLLELVPFELPLHVALHRTHSRRGVTAILSIGNKSPHTSCFTLYDPDVEIYAKLIESINHLAAAATPAAHAA
jgi:hypothetical protein